MIFYCETRMFSGQERMFLTGACYISRKEKSVLLINENNKDGIAFAESEGSFNEIKLLADFNEMFSSVVVWFRWKNILSLYKFFLNKKETVCVSQGRIESGNIGIIAAKLANVKTISYIPMVHSHREMGGDSLVSTIKDFLCKPLYHLPDSYITISDAVKQELSKKCNVYIHVVENFIQQQQINQINEPPPLFDEDGYFKIVVPGRLQNKQKGQLDFINAFDRIRDKINKPVVCYFVGNGPDFDLLQNKVENTKLNNIIFLLGNRNDLLNIMMGSNLVVLPSRFEGVPLVLLEAASLNATILASNIIGFNNYLPAECLFETRDIDSLASKLIEKINNKNATMIEYNKSLIDLIRRNKKEFTDDFYNALFS